AEGAPGEAGARKARAPAPQHRRDAGKAARGAAVSVEALARALLYEGYLLYPYRASALKNRRRWAFGALFPPAWPDEPSKLRAECLLEGGGEIEVRARFLQLGDGGAIEREARGPFSFGALSGTLEVHIEPLAGLRKVIVELANTSRFEGGD